MNWKGFLLKYGRIIVPVIMVTVALISSIKNSSCFIEGMFDNC